MPLEYALQFRGRFPDPGPWKTPECPPLETSEYVGIDGVPRQCVTRLKKRPAVFNIMVAGESGLGKTTFINTLFHSVLKDPIVRNQQETKTVTIEAKNYELTEGQVTLKLCVVDTPGFGDKLNRSNDVEPLIEYIDDKYRAFLESERFKNFRQSVHDTRIHCLLYFIPAGKKLMPLDIDALQKLCAKVNVVPLIAKADALTIEERGVLKRRLLQQFEDHEIQVYPLSFAEDKTSISHLEPYVPFAIVGANDTADVGGKKARGRRYRWGFVDVEDESHSDFVHLRELIMSRNLHDLIESTNNVHYANYRSFYLRSTSNRRESMFACDDDYEDRIENTQRVFREDMARKEEEMRLAFVKKVREKEASLREAEDKLARKRDELLTPLTNEKMRLREAMEEVDSLLLQMSGGGKKRMK